MAAAELERLDHDGLGPACFTPDAGAMDASARPADGLRARRLGRIVQRERASAGFHVEAAQAVREEALCGEQWCSVALRQ